MENKNTKDFVGYHKFVRLSTLDDYWLNSIGYSAKDILKKELNLSNKACAYVTVPIYEDSAIHDTFNFVSELDLLTIIQDSEGNYKLGTIIDFLSKALNEEELEEIRILYHI